MEPPFFVAASPHKNAPIGVFDSGIGGVTVLKALQEAFPHESFVYIADGAHSPYGTKGASLVHGFAQELVEFLVTYCVKAIVVACNTASAVLKQAPLNGVHLPVFEVITPTVQSVTGQHIAVIATATTIQSAAYSEALAEVGKTLEWAKATPMLVPLVEEGLAEDKIAQVLINYYLADLPLIIDTLILGCTHYPVLKPKIQALFPHITLVDAAEATALAVKAAFYRHNLNTTSEAVGTTTVFTTGEVAVFDALAKLSGFNLPKAKKLNLENKVELLKYCPTSAAIANS